VIANHYYTSIHLIHAEYGCFFGVFLFIHDVFGQYQSSLSLEIDNWRTGDHICLLGYLLHPNIEGITVDIVAKNSFGVKFGVASSMFFLVISYRWNFILKVVQYLRSLFLTAQTKKISNFLHSIE
jgi:hypothetical protein